MITYDITVYNDGEEAIVYADVGDDAPDGAVYLGMTPSIAGGSSYSFPFSFTVRQQDADAGQVENTAEAAVRLPDDSMITITSTVTSPAGNDPVPAEPGPVDDFCRMVEVTKEDGTIETDFELCTEHLITEENAAADPSSAVEIWKTEIDAEFADLLGLVSAENAELLKAKQEAFAAALNEAEAAAADDAEALELLIEKLEDFCADLCYIEHTAEPEEIAGLVPDTF